jgi:hypothetical protein
MTSSTAAGSPADSVCCQKLVSFLAVELGLPAQGQPFSGFPDSNAVLVRRPVRAGH